MSSFQLAPYQKSHVLPMLEQGINANIRGQWVNGKLVDLMATLPSSTTVLVKERPMVCGGVIKLWENRGCLWTVFNEESKNCFLPTFRGIQSFLKVQQQTYRRLEMAVPVGFPVGHRRALALGFKVECGFAESYLPTGEDCVLYALIRKGA